jgi:hypothetical protein
MKTAILGSPFFCLRHAQILKRIEKPVGVLIGDAFDAINHML